MNFPCAITLCCAILLNGSLAAAANVLPWEQELPFEEGVIRYVISGLEQGKETIYIRDWGRQRATYHESSAEVMGVTMRTAEVEFRTPEFIYSYNLQEKQGFKAVNPQKYMADEYRSLTASEQLKVRENAEKMGAAYAEGMGGRVVEKAETILGYSCDKVDISGGSVTYLIHGTDIPLKTEMNMMGMQMTIMALAVEPGPVDDEHFKHPEGIVAEEDPASDAMSKKMALQAIAMLKDPGAAEKDSDTVMGLPPQVQNGMSEEDKKIMQDMLEGFQDRLKIE